MRAPKSLREYRRKRDPRRTPEPMGKRRRRAALPRFVVQKHAARRLHYDLRLEYDGVLKSWAVPKGPSLDPQQRRLAVAVEDHPLDYAQFEGVIPAGNYGAGAVIVWDQGAYSLPTGANLGAQLTQGKIEVELEGEKLRGRWALVRTGPRRPADGKQWLLFKKPDAYATGPEPTDIAPESVLSGQTVEELSGQPAPIAAVRRRLAAARLSPAVLTLRSLPLALPTLHQTLPKGRGWLYEIKWDGVRVLIIRTQRRVRLLARSGADVTARYPEVAATVEELPDGDLALDGEIVTLDEQARPSFVRLQQRMHLSSAAAIRRGVRSVPALAYVFDCLACDGYDVRPLPLLHRKAIVRSLLSGSSSLRYCDHVADEGAAFLEEVAAAGLEGVIAKRAASPYPSGRTEAWRKVKCPRRQNFVIGGFTAPKGARAHLGALHVGVYRSGKLVYVGRVGSGLSDVGLADLADRLRALEVKVCPFAREATVPGHGHRWVRPQLVCEVRFSEWTPEGSLRHPVFVGLRADRRATAVHRE